MGYLLPPSFMLFAQRGIVVTVNFQGAVNCKVHLCVDDITNTVGVCEFWDGAKQYQLTWRNDSPMPRPAYLKLEKAIGHRFDQRGWVGVDSPPGGCEIEMVDDDGEVHARISVRML